LAVIKFTNSKSGIGGILDYITKESKTEQRLISGKDCMPESALAEMKTVKNMYGKNGGRQYIHIVQSFDPKDTLSYEDANKIGVLLAERFVGFQAVIATHKDTENTHNHILLNSVNFETGLKFQQSKKDMQAVKDFSDELCLAHGLSIIEKPSKNTDIQKNEYRAALKGESWKMALIVAIDRAMVQSRNREEFISNMNHLGYEVNWTDTRKYITYTTPEGKKCRDNKLHDKKYLKEEMENQFREVEAYTRGAEPSAAVPASAGLSADDRSTKSAAQTTIVGDGKTQKRSIFAKIADAEVEIKRSEAEKAALGRIDNNRDNHFGRRRNRDYLER
jgi:hypothetical protein